MVGGKAIHRSKQFQASLIAYISQSENTNGKLHIIGEIIVFQNTIQILGVTISSDNMRIIG